MIEAAGSLCPPSLLFSPIFGYLWACPIHATFETPLNVMARGIHLKELRSTDLEAIGVPDDGLFPAQDGEKRRSHSLLDEADPVLSRTLREMRESLEATLRLLDEALSSDVSAQAPPATGEE